MISFRYHVVSIVAVFLALALGVVVGTTVLNGPITTNLRQQVASLKSDRSSLTSQNSVLQNQLNDSNQFASTFGGQIVQGALAGQSVAIIGMPGASDAIQNSLAAEVVAAGGKVADQAQFTADFTDPRQADDIRSLVVSAHPIGLVLPTVTDPGTLAGSLIGYVLLSGHSQQTDIQQVFTAFATQQLLRIQSGTLGPATLALIVTSGSLAVGDAGGQTELSLITRLGLAGGGTVVAGDTPSSTQGGLVALVRASAADKASVSTVDDADTAGGQVTTVLALASAATGKSGAYGTGSGAVSLFPAQIATKPAAAK